MDQGVLLLVIVVAVLAITILRKTAVVVPQQSAYIVQRLGKYHSTLNAGFHILLPFVESVAYRDSLKESAVDIPEQVCITKDNVQVGIDGVLYLQVLDAARASYGISDYHFAISQLAQTTLRSEIGKIDLDRTFEERSTINSNVVNELDKATEPWGVKVLRYEIKNINPPRDIIQAMEKQMRAEREKRAVILDFRRRARRQDQPGRRREAARHQGVRGREAAADQRGGRSGRGDSRRCHRDGRRFAARGRSPSARRAAAKPCSYAWPRNTSASSATSRAPRNTLVVPANLSDIAGMIALATKVFDQARPAAGAPAR